VTVGCYFLGFCGFLCWLSFWHFHPLAVAGLYFGVLILAVVRLFVVVGVAAGLLLLGPSRVLSQLISLALLATVRGRTSFHRLDADA